MGKSTNKTLSDRIREARGAKGLSQDRAAEIAGMGHQTLWWRIENGWKVSPKYAAGVSRTIGIPVHELLNIDPVSISTSGEAEDDFQIPIIRFEDASQLQDEHVSISDLRPIGTISLPIPLEHKRMIFALKIEDDTMLPLLKAGNIVIVELGSFDKIKDQSIVAAVTKSGLSVLRRYHLKRSGFELEDGKGNRLESKKDGLVLLGPAIKLIQDI